MRTTQPKTLVGCARLTEQASLSRQRARDFISSLEVRFAAGRSWTTSTWQEWPGGADSSHGKRQKIHMKRKRCAKCSGKGTVLCAVCEYLSVRRANYGWISPFNKERYAQAPSRSGRHKRKSAKF